MIRADMLLVQRGLAASRTLAQRLIAEGRVLAGEPAAPVRKSSEQLAADATLQVLPGDTERFVSRGGLKLAGALAHCGVDVRGLACLDVGQSTGGFTDCLLQAGASRVVGVDVGHDQLHARIAADPRVVAIEGINARSIGPSDLGRSLPAGGFDLIVVDVSFISLTKVLPALAALAAPGGRLIALVKPQFEVGRRGLDRRGIVRDSALYGEVRAAVTRCAEDCGWQVLDWLDSPITGGDGNREFFIHASRRAPAAGDARNEYGTPS